MLKKILQGFFIVLLTAILGISIFCVALPQKGKTTIIIVPGLLASTLVVGEEELPLWDPFNSEHSMVEILDGQMGSLVTDFIFNKEYSTRTSAIIADIVNNNDTSILKMMAADENGIYNNNGIHAASMQSEPNMRYGAFNSYKIWYDYFYEKYGKSCIIDIFQYDWRKDNRENGHALEEYINEMGYENIVFLAHSMGNLVTSQYLARSESNRDKVKGFVSVAAPYYGSLNALSILESAEGLEASALNAVKDNLLANSIGLNTNTVSMIFQTQVYPLLYNLVSVAQLLPTIELAEQLKSYYGKSFLSVNGEEITTQNQLNDFYSSRPWALKDNSIVKPYIKDLANYNKSFYVDDGKGNLVHASKLVNTYYLAGSGIDTSTHILKNGENSEEIFTTFGDGTVPLLSAILDYEPDSQFVHIYDGYDHLTMGCKFIDTLADDLDKIMFYMI